MLHRLCGPPSIPLSFNLATVLPRRDAQSVSCATDEQARQRLASIVYGVDYQGISSCLLPTLSRLSVRTGPVSRLRHWCSCEYLRISPLHSQFHSPLPVSSRPVSKAILRLSL